MSCSGSPAAPGQGHAWELLEAYSCHPKRGGSWVALNRVGEKGPGPTSAASELGGRGWGTGAGRQEKAEGRGFLMVVALTRSCDSREQGSS